MLSPRIVDTGPGRIRVEDPPSNSPAQDLAQRLGRLEAMPLRQRRPPRADLVRSQLDDAPVAERARRLRQQPAQLRDRARCRLMLREVFLDELAQRDLREAS